MQMNFLSNFFCWIKKFAFCFKTFCQTTWRQVQAKILFLYNFGNKMFIIRSSNFLIVMMMIGISEFDILKPKKHKNTTCRTTQTRPCGPTHPSRSATPPWRTLRTLTRRRATLIEIQRLVESLLCLYDAQPLKTKVETNLNKPRFGQCWRHDRLLMTPKYFKCHYIGRKIGMYLDQKN